MNYGEINPTEIRRLVQFLAYAVKERGSGAVYAKLLPCMVDYRSQDLAASTKTILNSLERGTYGYRNPNRGQLLAIQNFERLHGQWVRGREEAQPETDEPEVEIVQDTRPQKVKTSALSVVRFDGDQLEAIKQGQTVWVSVRRVCEALGVDTDSQRKKLKDCPWACTVIIAAQDTTGRNQDAFCIDLESLPMWLANIHASKIREDLRPKLLQYQRECKRALAEHFGLTKSRRPTTTEQLTEAIVRVTEMAQQSQALILHLYARFGEQPPQLSCQQTTQER